jgi:hypothetical protein
MTSLAHLTARSESRRSRGYRASHRSPKPWEIQAGQSSQGMTSLEDRADGDGI